MLVAASSVQANWVAATVTVMALSGRCHRGAASLAQGQGCDRPGLGDRKRRLLLAARGPLCSDLAFGSGIREPAVTHGPGSKKVTTQGGLPCPLHCSTV